MKYVWVDGAAELWSSQSNLENKNSEFKTLPFVGFPWLEKDGESNSDATPSPVVKLNIFFSGWCWITWLH